MISDRRAMWVLFTLYSLVAWTACGHGVKEYCQSVEGWMSWYSGSAVSDVDGFFPKLGAFFHEVAGDLGGRLYSSAWFPGDEKLVGVMNGLVIVQVVVVPMAIAAVLVCVTAIVMRRFRSRAHRRAPLPTGDDVLQK